MIIVLAWQGFEVCDLNQRWKHVNENGINLGNGNVSFVLEWKLYESMTS